MARLTKALFGLMAAASTMPAARAYSTTFLDGSKLLTKNAAGKPEVRRVGTLGAPRTMRQAPCPMR